MIVLHVTSIEFNDRGKRNWMLFEVEAENMEAVVTRLNKGELVFGYALQVRKDDEDSKTRIVVGAAEVTIQIDEVHRIQTPWWSLVRYEDEVVEEAEA